MKQKKKPVKSDRKFASGLQQRKPIKKYPIESNPDQSLFGKPGKPEINPNKVTRN